MTTEEGLAQTRARSRALPLCPSPASSVNLKSGGSFQGHPLCLAFKRMQRESDLLGRTRSYLTFLTFNRKTSLTKPEVLFWRIKRESDRASLFMTFMSHCSRGSREMAKIPEKLHSNPNSLSALISRPISTRACANSPLSSRFRPFPPFLRPLSVLTRSAGLNFAPLPPSARALPEPTAAGTAEQPPPSCAAWEGETDESGRATRAQRPRRR